MFLNPEYLVCSLGICTFVTKFIIYDMNKEMLCNYHQQKKKKKKPK